MDAWMKRSFTGGVLLFTLIALIGCSTDSITAKTGGQVPQQEAYIKQYTQPHKVATARIGVFRDAGFAGAACTDVISLNNQKVFRIDHGQYAIMYVQPGQHLLKTSTGEGICPNNVLTSEINIKAG